MPKRIQRRRVRGWRMPENTIYVGRPTAWGNPYKIGAEYKNPFYIDEHDAHFQVTPDNCLSIFKLYADAMLVSQPSWLKPLRGKDLACWCPLPEDGEPDMCHAAILLRLANQ